MKAIKIIIFVLFICLGLISLKQLTVSQSPVIKSPQNSEESVNKLYGVNISGGEFGENSLPGVMDKDYIYPNSNKDLQYFADKGIKLIRLPIRWERVQHAPYGPLHEPDIREIMKIFAIAERHDMKVILDLHNFARFYGTALTIDDAGKLADVWKKLAIVFGNDPALYGYELMNEPHDLPGGSNAWAQIAQITIQEIRKVDSKTMILVPGYNWQSARTWTEDNPHFPLKDPGNNIIYTAHIYFDSNESGRYAKSFDEEAQNIQIGVNRSADFREWLSKNNLKGMFTEFGVPDSDQRWMSAMDIFLESINTDSHIIGALYWSGGPWWKNYPLSIEPKNGVDRPQMQILEKYIN
jgi:endoglucanase